MKFLQGQCEKERHSIDSSNVSSLTDAMVTHATRPLKVMVRVRVRVAQWVSVRVRVRVRVNIRVRVRVRIRVATTLTRPTTKNSPEKISTRNCHYCRPSSY